jgi:predicted nucleotidyltransferase
MKTSAIEELRKLSLQLPEKIPYLKMLVLFGSRATGKSHANSDWDFAALYDEELHESYCKDKAFAWFEVSILLGQAFDINSANIDVIELNNCSPLIAHFVARDGKVLYEKESGEFEKFRQRSLKSEREMKEIRKTLREKVEASLQRWGV